MLFITGLSWWWSPNSHYDDQGGKYDDDTVEGLVTESGQVVLHTCIMSLPLKSVRERTTEMTLGLTESSALTVSVLTCGGTWKSCRRDFIEEL